MLQRVDLLTHGAGIADDAPRPFEYAHAFRREVLEAGAAVDQEDAESVFKLFDARGQGRLGDTACFRRPPEMLFARQGKEEFKLIDQSRTKSG